MPVTDAGSGVDPRYLECALVQEGSTDAQRVLRTTLGMVAEDAAAAGIRPPAVVVIGEVVDVLA
mgnify:CR=1 FL=1